MKKIKKILISLAVFLILLFPVFSFAAQDPSSSGLVPCNNTPADLCDFTAFMKLINNVIDFIFKYMAVPIAAIMFFYAGFLMVTSGGSSESKTRAKSIFSNAVLGLVVAAGAWLIVKTILSILVYKDIGTFF